ncbi:glycosyltransferase family 2 protein [Flavobacterium sp. N2270]|uniref:glycosyltransferase family 2 protein n=1 Tax=Flavobacterium sp. N2270 TaxID=2986831 RepID=UPI002223FD76|nr:glycosyltransferase family 2 protein [Flavobacterium sp. N2270]
MQTKKIAVVVPVYNRESTILKSLKSLENQTFKDWFCIIVNDGSTDNTKEVISTLDVNKYLVVNFSKNMGRGSARQAAIDMVRSLKIPYMCMLDADDFYFPDKLEFQFNYMEQHPDVTLLSSAMALSDKNNNLYSVIRPFENETAFYFNSFINFIQLPHASSIIRIQDIEGVNYDKTFRFSEDLDFLRRILIKKKYAFTPRIHYGYKRDNSFSFYKYFKSISFNIKSFNRLEVSILQKIKYATTSVLKTSVVFILSIFGVEKLYLSKVGQKPSLQDCKKYENFEGKF